MKSLKNTAKINWWDDTKIKSGEEWDKEIKEALRTTKVAILIASANFFASDYIWNKELPTLLKAAEEEDAVILWFPVGHYAYEDTEIINFQSVVDDITKSLKERTESDREKVYTEIVRRIKEILKPK